MCRLYLSSEAKVRLPDVDEALDKGHAIHGADDLALRGTGSQALAQRIVQDFLSLREEFGTPEFAYLSAMHDVARGFGRALTREKNLWIQQVEAARVERERRDGQLRSKWESKGLGVMWKSLWPIILGLSGFLFAKVLGVTVLEDVTPTTGTNIPSVIMSLAFILAGRLLGRWLYDRKRDKIINTYDAKVFLAGEAYELAKLREFKHWRQKGIETWKQYTGEDYPERASYQMVMEGDMETRRKIQEHLLIHDRTDIERLKAIVGKMRPTIFRRKQKAQKAPPIDSREGETGSGWVEDLLRRAAQDDPEKVP